MDKNKIAKNLEALCLETGEFILENRRKVAKDEVEVKSLNSLVSYVDQETERRLVKGLLDILPEAGFITEEETVGQVQKDWYWIVDPLDGTTNFLFDLPIFAISVALYHKNQPQVAVVYELGQKELFSAIAGEGAYLNGKAIKVRSETKLSECLIATGFPYYDFDRLQNFNKLLAELYTQTRGVRRLGSAATDLAYVAAGRFNGFFEYGLSPWDVAAGILLVQEAGGKVSDFKLGDDYLFGKEIIAGADLIFQDFAQLVKIKMADT